MRRLNSRMASLAAATAMTLGLAATALAAPNTISYVGQLTTSGGTTVDGDVAITVALYDAVSGGSLVRAPEDLGVLDIADGLLRFDLGNSGDAISDTLMANEDLWIEVTIDGEALSPRQKMESVPYARWSADAVNLGGIAADDYSTEAELAATIAKASSSSTAPANPTAGTLWWNESTDTLSVWDSGIMDWVEIQSSGGGGELPPNGVNAVSNGMLSNEFEGVTYLWSEGADIADATLVGPGSPALAEITVNEDTESYIYNIRVDTNFTLTSSNTVSLRLFPPPALGIAPIEFRNQLLPFGSYGDIWTVDNAPELAQLLNTNPSGVWTIAVVDSDNNLSDGGANIAGTLNAFQLTYDIVRADNIAGQGTLEVDTLKVNGPISGTLTSGEDGLFTGQLSAQDNYIRRVQYQTFADDLPDTSGFTGRQMTFTKLHDDTWLRFEWNDNTRISTTGQRYYEIRINGNNCNAPHNLRFSQIAWNSSNGYDRLMSHAVGYCQRFSGITPVPDVNGGVNIPAGTYTIQIYQSSSNAQIGYNNSYGSLMVEEVLP